jgi:hypothetical protein
VNTPSGYGRTPGHSVACINMQSCLAIVPWTPMLAATPTT